MASISRPRTLARTSTVTLRRLVGGRTRSRTGTDPPPRQMSFLIPKVKSTWIQKALLGLKPDQSIPSAGLMRATSMNSLLDPFLYELVRAHEQELLEAARVSRVLGTGNRRAFAA